MSARRLLVVLAAAVCGCREIPAPEGGVQSLSRVVLPSPGLVVGDTMRDSLGNAAPLRIVAFGAGGDTVTPAPPVTFLLLDTTATLDDNVIVGRTEGRARVIATVAGLQSRIDTILVTLRPDTIVSDSTRYMRVVDVALVDTAFASPELVVVVQHREGTTTTGVDAVVVKYTLTRSTEAKPGEGPSVLFGSGSSTEARDTTSGGGRAGRTVRLRKSALHHLPDSAMVAATASYRGQSLGTVQFTIVFQSPTP